MKRKIILTTLLLSLLLSGCSWPNGRYVSVTPHREERQTPQTEGVTAASYLELIQVLEDRIREGTQNIVINVADYPESLVQSGMNMAVRYAMNNYPIGAYAVEEITYEEGTTAGQPAMAVTVTYRHGRAEIQKISHLKDMTDAETYVTKALRDYDANVVMLTNDYEELDFQQMVRSYAETYPEVVMETPLVTESYYGSGEQRVVELTFTYQTARDAMRQMQSQIKPVFEAAELYVSGDGADRQKFSQLYAFLMERFDYKVETSITPAYSLLRHGVGDSRAFATVYASMCRGAGLDCQVVTGTRSGEPWTWNIISVNGTHQHVDLLRCNQLGSFRAQSDWEMEGYVWDYSAYPECPVIRTQEPDSDGQETEAKQEETQPAQMPTEPTSIPEETQETVPVETEVPEETDASTETEEKNEEI